MNWSPTEMSFSLKLPLISLSFHLSKRKKGIRCERINIEKQKKQKKQKLFLRLCMFFHHSWSQETDKKGGSRMWEEERCQISFYFISRLGEKTSPPSIMPSPRTITLTRPPLSAQKKVNTHERLPLPHELLRWGPNSNPSLSNTWGFQSYLIHFSSHILAHQPLGMRILLLPTI